MSVLLSGQMNLRVDMCYSVLERDMQTEPLHLNFNHTRFKQTLHGNSSIHWMRSHLHTHTHTTMGNKTRQQTNAFGKIHTHTHTKTVNWMHTCWCVQRHVCLVVGKVTCKLYCALQITKSGTKNCTSSPITHKKTWDFF